jgi:predicted transcriptional regulator YdeE
VGGANNILNKGTSKMQIEKPEIVTLGSLIIAGLTTRTCNQDEANTATAKIPTLWSQAYSSQTLQPNTLIGVYYDYESDDQGYYTLTVGNEVSPATIDSLDSIKIASGDYLVFRNQGPQPQAIITLWQTVWAYFKAHKHPKRIYQTDFEVYKDGICEIYIGI